MAGTAYSLRVVPPKSDPYWTRVQIRAAQLGSDACTGVPDFYKDLCHEHDIHWRTGRTLWGAAVSKQQANNRFAQAIWARASENLTRNPTTWGNLFGYPMGVWRWAAVSLNSAVFQPLTKRRRHWWRNTPGTES